MFGNRVAIVRRWILIVLIFLAAPLPAADDIRILAFGDSLTAGYGLPEGKGFTVQMEAALREQGYPVEVLNAGVSGDTTAAGRSRLEWTLAENPDLVVLALGGNDGLRAINPAETRANLAAMLEVLRQRNFPVLLVGMYAPPNLGRDYAETFNAIYPELAEQYRTALYPFFLEGVAADRALNLPDGIHPNAEGVAVIIERMVPYVIRLIEANGLGTNPAEEVEQ